MELDLYRIQLKLLPHDDLEFAEADVDQKAKSRRWILEIFDLNP